jgi:hypothetical protein
MTHRRRLSIKQVSKHNSNEAISFKDIKEKKNTLETKEKKIMLERHCEERSNLNVRFVRIASSLAMTHRRKLSIRIASSLAMTYAEMTYGDYC